MTTAHHWRDVRQFIRESGIGDPMALPNMHALLDYTEKMTKQAIASGGTDRAKVESELAAFNQRLYGPQAYAKPAAPGVAAEPVLPDGFDDADEQHASFDALAAALGSGAR